MDEPLDQHRVLGGLHQAGAAREMDTAHLCDLSTLSIRVMQANLASLREHRPQDHNSKTGKK